MRVWTCKIVIEEDSIPMGFDSPPRRAAIEAVERAGFAVLGCFSGWGGQLTDIERQIVDENRGVTDGVHVAGSRGEKA